jgi:HEAT repeat protein
MSNRQPLALALSLALAGLWGSAAGENTQERLYDGKTVSQWAQQLQSSDAAARAKAVEALEALSGFGPVEAAVGPLVQALQGQDGAVADLAAKVLARSKSAAAVRPLTELLRHDDARVRCRAATALAGASRPPRSSCRRWSAR